MTKTMPSKVYLPLMLILAILYGMGESFLLGEPAKVAFDAAADYFIGGLAMFAMIWLYEV